MAVKEVVSQHQGNRVTIEEISPNQKSLRQAIGAGLHGITDGHPPGTAISQQALKGLLVMGRGDDQHLTNPSQHQGAERIVNHRLVVHRHQLLADRRSKRSQASAAATRQDDALAIAGRGHRADDALRYFSMDWPSVLIQAFQNLNDL